MRLLALILPLLPLAVSLCAEAREAFGLNDGWLYAEGPLEGATAPDYPDGAPKHPWQPIVFRTVDLPHDMQFERPWDRRADAGRGFKAMAEGVYRRRIFADPAWKGRRVSVDFGGIMLCGEVYWNGAKVATSDYGYLGFEVDVTDRLRWGETNLLAVVATTGRVKDSRWYTGGGLYRGVRLVVRDRVSVARHGVQVTTPQVTAASAAVAVKVDVEGFTRGSEKLVARTRLLSPDGEEVASAEATVPTDARTRLVPVSFPPLAVASPQLWDLDSPCMYAAVVTLRDAQGRTRDEVRTRFGIRTLEFRPDFGFRLNGRKVFLKGFCGHHDLGVAGAAAFPRAIERQFRRMKEFGFNAVRCSHNPYSEEFLDLADELGVLVVDEYADKWNGVAKDAFFPLLSEWVMRDRNHPSVILWSLGNELQHREDWSGFDSGDGGVTTYRIFDAVVKRFDPTRKTTVAMYPSRASGVTWNEAERFRRDPTPPPLAFATDVASFNYIWSDYPEFFRRKPDLVLFQSEASVYQLLEPYWGMDRARTVGLAYWGAVAYWGESQKWPAKGWTYSFFDHDLTPRPTAYLIRSAFRPDEPLVRLSVACGGETHVWNDMRVGEVTMSESWNCAPGEKVSLVVYTNLEDVELLLNGRSLGRKRNDAPEGAGRNVLTWTDIVWEPGRIEAVASRGGRELAHHALETAGKAVRLVGEPESARWAADGQDLLYVNLRAVDEAGRVDPTCAARVAATVDGPASLLGLDDGDHFTDELYEGNSRRLRKGCLLAVLRAGRRAGTVRISFSAAGLESAACEVRTAEMDRGKAKE